ncbi:MAG TPA: thermonuclease family protein [Sphingobium sp.]
MNSYLILGAAALAGTLGGVASLVVPAGSNGAPTALPAPSTTFSLCHTGGGRNCVVDGDTIWLEGVKIRVADIDAPETHPPRCTVEANLGTRATQRLQELINAGPFEVQQAPDGRDEDRYGRKLRVLVRHGQSLGDVLVSEGLARRWTGRREPWC